ncbi:lipoate--protein ligase [Bacilliculturomica massiliensis]|uniref:lipoate--protein ligase n=1 Tax=Bacilliculturomica massiliensis TaxID=1917867 RepID=UPI00103098A6|nr:lipoate--protein ligase [Bacilliculturomica massiliensis]
MYLTKNLSTDPYFNMAAEEYFLDRFDGDLIMLWRNDKTVVVGKNQNTAEEVDASYAERSGIAVVRRLSGGGAVFHDLGNVNYTVIETFRDGLFSNYEYFTKPVCDYIRTLGIDAELSGRNDLLIDGMKFCGNAQTKRGEKFMHHGCILFAADVADLSGVLTPGKLKIESKSVKSVRSRITNIASHLDRQMSAEDFFNGLYEYFLNTSPDVKEYVITEEDQRAIAELAKDKYETWEWNYGRSPAFTAGNAKKYEFGIVDARFTVREGRMEELRFYGDFFGVREISELEDQLRGVPYERAAILKTLEGSGLSDYIGGMTPEELTELLLG